MAATWYQIHRASAEEIGENARALASYGYNSTTCDRCKPGWPPNVQKAHKRGCSDAGIAPYPDSSVVAHSTHSPLLVLAVTTTATKKALGVRAEIRRGWEQMDAPGFVGRFAFGVHNHSATAAALAGEHATHRDLLFVAQSVSANGNARETVLGWWRVASFRARASSRRRTTTVSSICRGCSHTSRS